MLSAIESDDYEFKTPPRPQLASASGEELPRTLIEDTAQALPPDAELFSLYENERLRTQDSASAIALLAGAYGCSPDQVRSRVLAGLEDARAVPETRTAELVQSHFQEIGAASEPLPPLPPPTRPPPSLDCSFVHLQAKCVAWKQPHFTCHDFRSS